MVGLGHELAPAVFTAVNFNATSFDSGGMADLAANTITAPRSGRYLAIGGASFVAEDTGDRFAQLVATLGGASKTIAVDSGTSNVDDNNAGTDLNLVTFLSMSAGDSVRLEARQNVTGALRDLVNGEGTLHLALYWLGP